MKKKFIMGILLSIPVSVVTVNATVTMLQERNINVPTINSAEYINNEVRLNWDISINDSSIFVNENYEGLSLDIPNGIISNVYMGGINGYTYDGYGNLRENNDVVRNSLKIINGVGYNNSKGAIATKTTPNNGWSYTYYSYLPKPNGVAQRSSYTIDGWKQLEVDKPAIIRVKAKGSGNLNVAINSGWSGNAYKEQNVTWAENLTADEFKNRLITSTPIKINNPTGKTDVNFHLSTAFVTDYSYNFLLSLGNFENQNGQWVFQPKQWYGAWQDCVRPGQYVTPASQRTVEPIEIGKNLYRLHSNGGSSGSVNINTNNNDWSNYSFNINIPNSNEILGTNRYFTINNSFETSTSLSIDDLVIAYAPKSRVYRDGNVVFDGYGVDFNDKNAIDNAIPNEPKVSFSYNNNKPVLNWDKASDNGTSYKYELVSVNEFNVESSKSQPLTVNTVSGIKNYEVYVNDKLVTTTSLTSYELGANVNIDSNTKIKVVAIDNVGNKSNSNYIDIPTLTAVAKPSENIIRLDWTMNNIKDKTFKVYQKKPGSNEFQTISTMNFDKTKQVKVLNVYPYTTASISFSTWDGENLTLPISAQLKKWMEEPNSENPKGYGKGLIEVDSVTINAFNEKPTEYLKNADGSYKYDVIMFGSYDSNGNSDLSNLSMLETKEFIDKGRGVLFGHDTVTKWNNRVNFALLEEYINVKTYGFTGSPSATNTPDKIWTMPWSGGTEIKITKKGILNEYPWVIGDLDQKLIIPYTHSNSQISKGDIWMKFSNPISDVVTNVPIDTNEYSDNGVGTNMAYLSSWNNTAMIQTGHAIGRYNPTPDEQKVMANTLFYLNQLSSDNFLDDYSGQDVSAPNKPSVKTFSFNKTNININLNETLDNGSNYEYYVQSESKDGSSNTVSNISKTTITSGFKGYSYIVDTKTDTIPDDTIETSSNNFVVNMSNKILYVHVKAIDNVGNSSETLHYKVEDITPPTLNVSGDLTTWTKDNIALNISASDSQTGVNQIILPNGNVVNGSSATFVASNNETLVFKAIDNVGNEISKSIVIDKIDRVPPVLTATKEINSNKQSGFININIKDTLSGVDYFILPDGTEIKGQSDYKYPINSNGMYLFTGYDKLGNSSFISVEVSELNANINPSGISKIEYKLTGATVQDWTIYTSAFYIKNEGITYITARSYDNAGNVSNEEVSEVKIDKTRPINNGIKIELKL